MGSILILVLITYVVPVVLSLISRSAERQKGDSLYDFSMKPPAAMSTLGMILTAIFLLFLIILIANKQFRGASAVVSVCLVLLGLMLILSSVKGFWETEVKGDDITASRFWVIKEYAKISEIDHCQQVKGGIHIYVKGRKSKALSIDGMCTNILLFEDRMAQEGVEIRPFKKN